MIREKAASASTGAAFHLAVAQLESSATDQAPLVVDVTQQSKAQASKSADRLVFTHK